MSRLRHRLFFFQCTWINFLWQLLFETVFNVPENIKITMPCFLKHIVDIYSDFHMERQALLTYPTYEILMTIWHTLYVNNPLKTFEFWKLQQMISFDTHLVVLDLSDKVLVAEELQGVASVRSSPHVWQSQPHLGPSCTFYRPRPSPSAVVGAPLG